jgi:hypothetical protein
MSELICTCGAYMSVEIWQGSVECTECRAVWEVEWDESYDAESSEEFIWGWRGEQLSPPAV